MIHMVGSGNLTGSFLGVGWEILHIGQGEGLGIQETISRNSFIPSGIVSCLITKNWNSFLLT